MQAGTRGMVKQATVEADIVRCTCGHPEGHAGQICPQGRHEDLGVIAYYHRRWWRRWAWWLWERVKRRG